MVRAIRFGRGGWLSGMGAWQWDRYIPQIRCVVAGDDTLCRRLESTLHERGHRIMAKLALRDSAQIARAGAELEANVLGLCFSERVRAEERRALRAVCDLSDCPAVVFAPRGARKVFPDLLQAGVCGCLDMPAGQSEILAMLGIAAARFEQFHVLRRRVVDLEWAVQNSEALEKAAQLVAARENLSVHRARRRLCAMAIWHSTDLRQLAQDILNAHGEASREG